MHWTVKKSTLSGTLAVPPSKSHSIRGVLFATLADGESTLHNVLTTGDGASAIGAARGLGAVIEPDGRTLRIRGAGNAMNRGADMIDCGNSGTTTNLFVSAAALGARLRRFDGDASLRSRPLHPLLDALGTLGASVTRHEPERDLPLSIGGPIDGGEVTVNGVSSQYVSSLLVSTPRCRRDTILHVINPQEKPYIGLTLKWLDSFGIRYEADEGYTLFTVFGNQHYAPFERTIPGDFSSATFGAVAGAICGKGIELRNLDFSDPQGDKLVFDIIERFGARVERAAGGVRIGGGGPLRGIEADLNAVPDALPALCVLACAAEGRTVFHNVEQARIKETDRIAVMTGELKKMCARIEERPDGVVIEGGALAGADVHGHDDHRVVMALALAGMIAGGQTTIATAEAAAITYPSFVEDFATLGANISM